MKTLSDWRRDFQAEISKIWGRNRMSQRPSGCRSCLNRDTFRNTHSWLSTPSLSAKEQMLCNFLFSTETVASAPCLTRPLSPALHWWSLAGKNAMGPPSLSHRAEWTQRYDSQTEMVFTPSIITLRNASLPHKCKQRLVWILLVCLSE